MPINLDIILKDAENETQALLFLEEAIRDYRLSIDSQIEYLQDLIYYEQNADADDVERAIVILHELHDILAIVKALRY
jgi:hypothetical protein